MLKHHRSMISAAMLCCMLTTGCVNKASKLEPISPDLYTSGSAYVYQPINPTTVWFRDATDDEKSRGFADVDFTTEHFNRALLKDLDTQTVRIGVDNFTASGDLATPLADTTVKGNRYVLIVDYIMYHSRTIAVEDMTYHSPDRQGNLTDQTYTGHIPIYTGIGLRIRAEFTALEGGVQISGLPALAVAAKAGHITGRIAVQTMGITGKEITALMPIISDIDGTSIQNAAQAVAAIKSKIYEPDTTLYPKVIGFESPSLDPHLIRALTGHIYAAEHYAVALVADAPADTEGKRLEIRWDSPPLHTMADQ